VSTLSWASKKAGGYDPSQERDEYGRWTSGGGGAGGGKFVAEAMKDNYDEDRAFEEGFGKAMAAPGEKQKAPGYGAKDNPEKVAERIAGPLASRAAAKGGFSFRPGSKSPKTGYMVSLPTKEGMNHVVDIHEMASRNPPPSEKELRAEVGKRVHDWLTSVLPKVQSKDEHYLGGWMQKDDKGSPVALHLDVSQRFTDRDKATSAGRERNQLSIWHLDKGEEIPTGGTGK
jgi:hypothetical protein